MKIVMNEDDIVNAAMVLRQDVIRSIWYIRRDLSKRMRLVAAPRGFEREKIAQIAQPFRRFFDGVRRAQDEQLSRAAMYKLPEIVAYFELREVRKHLSAACYHWTQMTIEARTPPAFGAVGLAKSLRAINSHLTDCTKHLEAVKALQIEEEEHRLRGVERARRGGNRRKENLRPREEAAKAQIEALLAENPNRSSSDIAEALIGVGSINFKYRKLQTLASSAKKKLVTK